MGGWRDRATPVAADASTPSGWRARAAAVAHDNAPAQEPSLDEVAREARSDTLGKLRSALNGITLGAAPKIVSALDRLTGEGGDNAAVYSKAAADHPWAGVAGAAALPVPGMQGGGILKTLASRALPGAIVSGATSAIRGDSPEDVAKSAVGYMGLQSAKQDAGSGNYGRALLDLLGAGGVGSAITGTLASGVGKVASKVAQPMEMSDAARLLQARGVKGMTVGQMSPQSALAQMEDASTSIPVLGHVLGHQRAAGRESWQNAVLDRAAAPGHQLPGGSVQDRLAQAYESFGPAYDAVKSTPVQALGRTPDGTLAHLRAALDRAAKDPSVYATDADVNAASRFLGNESSLVDRAQLPAPGSTAGEPLTAAALLKARSNIRGAIRDAGRGSNYTAADLLRGGEQAVTGGLEAQLPPEALQKLRATDAQYGQYKMVEDAVRRAGDQPAGMGPSHLSAAIKAGMEGGEYARGGGGDLRELASAGRDVFESKVPHTGLRVLHGTAGTALSPALIGINASETAKRALFGQTGAQRALADALSGGASMELPSRTAALIAALRAHHEPISTPLNQLASLEDSP